MAVVGDFTFFHVTGQWRHLVDDELSDPDAYPDSARPTGKVTLRPFLGKDAAGNLRLELPVGNPTASTSFSTVTALVADGELCDLQGRPGVWLTGKASEWHVWWELEAELYWRGKRVPTRRLLFAYQGEEELHLNNLTPAEGLPDDVFPSYQDAALSAAQARAARDEAVSAASLAQSAAEGVQDVADQVAAVDASRQAAEDARDQAVAAAGAAEADAAAVQAVVDDAAAALSSVFANELSNLNTAVANASTSASNAATSATQASGFATTAAGHASAANTSRSEAVTAASNANTARSDAVAARGDAVNARDVAVNASSTASGHATAAETSATNAAASAVAADDAADRAELAAQEAEDTVAAGVPAASSTTRGGVVLAGSAPGELGGTWDHPSVVGWANKADLVGGVVPTSQLPARALVTTKLVNTTAERLALTDVQEGDFAVQLQNPGRGTYSLGPGSPSDEASWVLNVSPTDAVSSVNGYNGVVVLGKADVGLGNVANLAPADLPLSSATSSALAGKANTSHTHNASDVNAGTLAYARLPVGTGAGSVVAGDDARLANERTPTDNSVSTAKLQNGAVTQAKLNGDVTVWVQGLVDTSLVAAQRVLANLQTSAYTLALSDANRVVEVDSSSAVNVTVPPESAVNFPVGSLVEVAQLGTGKVTLVAGSGVTLQSAASPPATPAQYTSVLLRKRSANTWLVF
ncbi:minor tail protein [Gordonia phage Ghobes]|uniref:Minor tail protein n=1 Tax=Gordonia phage Ghobes TaxID=1887647 RepID=A0A1B3B062_9CAUD|nr:minor tail protein [Gordonia phage Ghobes]AOE44379.1 minor tail protein [Gordonia phage Ghobes]